MRRLRVVNTFLRLMTHCVNYVGPCTTEKTL